mgnify:CR=1 FL=1
MINRQIEVPQEVDLASLFGNFDENVKMLDKALSVNIASRDNALRVTGEEENVEKASQVINMLMQIMQEARLSTSRKYCMR